MTSWTLPHKKKKNTTPEVKIKPLKNDGWKTTFPLGWHIFMGERFFTSGGYMPFSPINTSHLTQEKKMHSEDPPEMDPIQHETWAIFGECVFP